MGTVISVLYLMGFSIIGVFAFKLILDYFSPKHVQRRKHEKFDWQHERIKLPVRSVSEGRTEKIPMDVKYCGETGKLYRRNYMPRCEGRRHGKDWIEIGKDSKAYEKAMNTFES